MERGGEGAVMQRMRLEFNDAVKGNDKERFYALKVFKKQMYFFSEKNVEFKKIRN